MEEKEITHIQTAVHGREPEVPMEIAWLFLTAIYFIRSCNSNRTGFYCGLLTKNTVQQALIGLIRKPVFGADSQIE